MSNQCDFEDYDVPRTSKTRRLNDVTPAEWDAMTAKVIAGANEERDKAYYGSASKELRRRIEEAKYRAIRETIDKFKWQFKPAQDDNVNKVVDAYLVRAEAGMNKYGVTTSANPLDLIEWLTHLQEELMDATVYIERTIEELNRK